MLRKLALMVAAALVSTSPAAAQRATAAQRSAATPAPQAVETSAPAARPVAELEDELSTTQHTTRIGGVDVKYTATAGTLLLRDEAGKPKAHAFFVAYTRDGLGEPQTRPITFAYNGGPGSASIWLHMGALGPRRAAMAADGFQPGPPYQIVDNTSSIIDITDLVMIDPVMTGYSRPAAGEPKEQFHGVNEDLRWVAEFIRTYLTRFDRWRSPKFLLGESYGTFRSAGLAPTLQGLGIELNGIVLVSSVLDFSTIRNNEGNDLPFITFLPTYTATAFYHKRLAPELQADMAKTLAEARAFAIGEYATALLKGNMLSLAERRAVAQKVSRYTGLSAEFVEQANLRVDAARFRKELLRDRRLVTGRLDGRFTTMDADAAGETQEFDPSNTALAGPYTALYIDYLRRQLDYHNDAIYYTSGPVRPWSYADYQNRYATHVDALRGAMTRNPYLKIFVANGYYDMATPFFGTEYTFNHLGWEPEYQQRVTMGYYEGGHMFYIRPEMLERFKADVAAFMASALPGRTTSDAGK